MRARLNISIQLLALVPSPLPLVIGLSTEKGMKHIYYGTLYNTHNIL
jgi:hypothetical protein